MFKLRSAQQLSNQDIIFASGIMDSAVEKEARLNESEELQTDSTATPSSHTEEITMLPVANTEISMEDSEEDPEDAIVVFPDHTSVHEDSDYEENIAALDWDLPFSTGLHDEQEEESQFRRRVYNEDLSRVRYNEKHIYRFCQQYDMMNIADCLLHMFQESKNITGSLRYIRLLLIHTDIDAEELYFLAEVRLAIALETERMLPWELLYILLQHVPGFPSQEEFLRCIIPAVQRQQSNRYVQKSQLLRNFLSNINYCPA